MGKLLVILIVLLISACSTQLPSDPPASGDDLGPVIEQPQEPEPGDTGQQPQNPGAGDDDQSPQDPVGEAGPAYPGDVGQPQLTRAQKVIVGDTWRRDFDVHGERLYGDLLLFDLFEENSKVTVVNLATGTMFVRDLAGQGFVLDYQVGEDSDYLFTSAGIAYPLFKDGAIFVEHLDIETGEIWRQLVGSEDKRHDFSYRCDDGLVIVEYIPQCEISHYFDPHSGRHLAFLDGTTASYYQGSYYSFSRQGDTHTVARYNAETDELIWATETDTELVVPRRDWVAMDGNTVLFLSDSTLALDYNTGEELWFQNLPATGIVGGNVVLCASDKIVIVEIVSGQIAQEIELTDERYFLWKDHLYISSMSYLRKVVPATAEVIWEQRMPDFIRPYSGINTMGYTEDLRDMNVLWVLAGEYPGGIAEERGYYELELTAVHPGTGHIIDSWEFTVPFQHGGPWYWPIKLSRDEQGTPYLLFETETSPIPFSGHLEFGEYSPGRSLLVIDANTGEELWEYQYPENHRDVLVSDSDYLTIVLDREKEIELQFLRKATGKLDTQIITTHAPSRMIGNRLLTDLQGEYILEDPFEYVINPDN